MRIIAATSIAAGLIVLIALLLVLSVAHSASRAYNVAVRPGSLITVTWTGNQRQFVVPEGVHSVRVSITER